MRAIAAVLLLALAAIGAPASATVAADPRFDAIVGHAKAQMLADPRLAVRDAETARRYAATVADPIRRDLMAATADWLQGEAYTRTGQNDRATPLIEQAVAVAARIEPRGRLHADALLSLGSVEAATGKVGAAMTHFHAAHDLFQRLGDARSRARAFTLIATLYYDANDQANALKYFGQALDVYHADPGLEIAIRNGRGIALRDLKRYGDAAAEFAAALKLARAMNSPTLIATILNNAARVALASGELRQADRAIAESMALARSAGAPLARQESLAAQSAFERHDLGRAAQFIAKAFAGVALDRTSLADREAHKTAYDVYSALGRDDLALAHLTALKRLDDEATDLARSNGAALMAARFDYANQEVRIATLKADDLQKSVAFERQRADSQRLLLFGGAGATLIVIGVLMFGLITIRRSRDKVRAANTDLAATNSALGKALAAKTEFLATTSHEIRTPLNGILGMTQVMLADPRIDAATRDRVSIVHGAGVTMRALVDDILDVAKMETGNLTIETVTFDLTQTLREATRMWAEQADAKGLSFTVDLSASPGRIAGDPARLRQIVFNLLSNALKFTPAGSITVRVAVAGARLRIAVIDTGIGIAPEHHQDIFESFRQADAGTTRQFGGTGLGLTICRNLSRAMGGDVTVSSDDGRGATFTLDLPLIVAADAAALPAPAPAACAAAGAGLVVLDRNPISRAMLRSLFEPRFGPVLLAASIDEACLLAADLPEPRVLMDDATLRAVGDLPAALAALRAAVPDGVLVALWPGDDDAGQRVLQAAGVDRIVAKPVAKAALVAAVCGGGEDAAVVTNIMTRAA